MNGEEKLNRLNTLLDEYEKGIKFVINNNTIEAEKYLNMSFLDLSKLGQFERNDAVYILARYALFVQKQANRHMSIKNWCESTIKLTVSHECNNYKAYSYEERKMMAIKDNDYAKKLYTLQVLAQTHVDNMWGLSEKIKFISSTLYNITRNHNG